MGAQAVLRVVAHRDPVDQDVAHEKYINPKKGFESYFISFDQGFASLEIMQRQDITTC